MAAASSSSSSSSASASSSRKRHQHEHKGPVPDYLKSLSRAQLGAATHPATGALCISAPPGSGKTRVLTSRVAWLVKEELIMPEDLVVVTFTNKAANEMRQRLYNLIGGDKTSRLVMGTFHAICARFLRRYGSLVKLPNNFSITDAEDSRKMLKSILDDMKPDLAEANIKIKPESAQSTISWAKAKDIDPIAYRASVNRAETGKIWRSGDATTPSYKAIMATVYEKYTQQLREANALDFDDLLVFGVALLRQHPSVVSNVRHTLVDEMQDTNTTQYQLMSLLASATRCVTTVGDPDQSVYGWRAAEVGNLDKMAKEFETSQFALEENYRSTGKILEAARLVIEQDKKREARGLFTSHPAGPPVTLQTLHSAEAEAAYIATEIKRLIAHSGGMLNYNDFVILLRYNALSREVERALQSESIPNRMVGGLKFFDRAEVKDVLAYLNLVVNPNYLPALVRVANVPKRGIGEKGLKDFIEIAQAVKMTPMELAELCSDTKQKKPPHGVKPSTARSISQLVGAVRELRKLAVKGAEVERLIEFILHNVGYQEHLQKDEDSVKARDENVKELISFSTIVKETVRATAELREIGQVADTDRQQASIRDESEGEGGVSEADEAELSPAIKVKAEQPSEDSKGSALLDELDDVVDDFDSEVKQQALSPSPPSKRKRGRPPKNSGKVKSEAIEIDDSSDESTTPPPSKKAVKGESKSKTNRFFERKPSRDGEEEDVEESDRINADAVPRESPLRAFLEACTLSTDTEVSSSVTDKTEAKVTMSTCHAAKGLEYPVVFVLGVEETIFPFMMCTKEHEIEEERRLLYVAMTRAQGLLYLTQCRERMVRGAAESRELSYFVSPMADRSIHGGAWSSGPNAIEKVDFGTDRPELDASAREVLAKVLNRPAVEKRHIDASVAEFERSQTAQRIQSLNRNPTDWDSNGSWEDFGSRFGGSIRGEIGRSRQAFGSSNLGGSAILSRYGMGTKIPIGGGRGGAGDGEADFHGRTSNAAGFSSALKAFGPSSSNAPGPTGNRKPNPRNAGFNDGWKQRSRTTEITGPRSMNHDRSFSSLGNESSSELKFKADSSSRQNAASASARPRYLDFTSNGTTHTSSDADEADASRPRADLLSFQRANESTLSSIASLLPGSGALEPLPPSAYKSSIGGGGPGVGSSGKSLGMTRRLPSGFGTGTGTGSGKYSTNGKGTRFANGTGRGGTGKN